MVLEEPGVAKVMDIQDRKRNALGVCMRCDAKLRGKHKPECEKTEGIWLGVERGLVKEEKSNA